MLKAIYPDIKRDTSDILAEFYVEGSRNNPEGTLPTFDPVQTAPEEKEAAAILDEKTDESDKPAETSEDKTDEAKDGKDGTGSSEKASETDDVLGMIDNLSFEDMLGGGGSLGDGLGLGEIKLDDLSLDDLLGGGI